MLRISFKEIVLILITMHYIYKYFHDTMFLAKIKKIDISLFDWVSKIMY